MKLIKTSTVLFAIVLLMMFAFPFTSTRADAGPRMDNLILRYYADVEATYAALKAGEIDAIGYEITSDLFTNAITDLNIAQGSVGDLGKYEFDIYNNYTAAPSGSLRSPTNYLEFRRALAFATPKTFIITTSCGGFANRIDQPLAYMHKSWRNQSYWYEDGTYPYEYNSLQAAAKLDAAGFVVGTDVNTYYDASYPGSVEYLRIHPDTGVTMPDLKICARSDDLRRLDAGDQLTANMRKLGVPVNELREDMSQLYDQVMGDFNYHVYTGGWSLSRFPPGYGYSFYHSDFHIPYGQNYITGYQADGVTPMYPYLDSLLYDAAFPASYADSQTKHRKALGEIVEQCITIELFSASSYWAWSTELKGVVNGEGVGIENGYTFMNAYKVGGGAIRYGIKSPPSAMNQMFSSWFYDYQGLDRMALYSGIDVPPYDLSVDQTGYITSWTTDTWFDPDTNETNAKISQTYRSDAWFVEPQTGNRLENVNMTNHYASLWYIFQVDGAWFNPSVVDIKTVRIVDERSIELYFTVPGYWQTYEGVTPIFSFNWMTSGSLSQQVTESLPSHATTGYIGCSQPVFWVISAESGGTPLTLGVDFDIYVSDGTSVHNADVRIINPAYYGSTIDIVYLAYDDAVGYTVGNMPWYDAFEGAGMFYATDFVPSAGGWLTLMSSAHYPMETPPLGEVDFVKKTNGCYKIDIFDVVIAASAYGSQGETIPSSNWFAGADLAPAGAKIDIFDIVTITGKYGTEFDCPP